jgi:hypothetical protein
LNLNILKKDNIVSVSLVNAIIYLNSIRELNIPNVRNYTYLLPKNNMYSHLMVGFLSHPLIQVNKANSGRLNGPSPTSISRLMPAENLPLKKSYW